MFRPTSDLSDLLLNPDSENFMVYDALLDAGGEELAKLYVVGLESDNGKAGIRGFVLKESADEFLLQLIKTKQAVEVELYTFLGTDDGRISRRGAARTKEEWEAWENTRKRILKPLVELGGTIARDWPADSYYLEQVTFSL